jgi:lipopolysaccharide export system permease protein
MGVFFKYVAVEVVVACFLSIVLFAGVLVAGNALRDIFERVASGHLSMAESVKIISIVLPSIVSYALPLGVLSGILIAVGRLSSSNEILAMKSSGISLCRISLPIFLFAALATVLSLLINLYYAPDSISEYRASLRKMLLDRPIRFIKAREFIHWFPGYVIYVGRISGEQLSDFKIWQLSKTGPVDVCISAAGGNISYAGDSGSLTLTMVDGSAEHFDRKSDAGWHVDEFSKTIFFEELSLALPLTEVIGERKFSEKKLRHMNIGELLHARRHWRSDGDATGLPSKHDRRLVDMHISNNIAMAFGVFAMALVAIPLGIRTNRTDTSINVALALLLGLGYYFSMVILSWFGDETRLHPEVLVWLPNIFLVLCGGVMFRKAMRN